MKKILFSLFAALFVMTGSTVFAQEPTANTLSENHIICGKVRGTIVLPNQRTTKVGLCWPLLRPVQSGYLSVKSAGGCEAEVSFSGPLGSADTQTFSIMVEVGTPQDHHPVEIIITVMPA